MLICDWCRGVSLHASPDCSRCGGVSLRPIEPQSMYRAAPQGFSVGDRVELHPATDAWMRGDRYGVVERIGREYVHVRMDRSGRCLPIKPDYLERIS